MSSSSRNGASSATGATRKKRWRERFLAALRDGGTVSEACRHAGIARSTAYRGRSADEEFAAEWEAIEETVTDELEAEAVRRAKDGSDTLLIFLLKSRRPAIYRERYRPEPTRPASEHPTKEEFDREVERLVEHVRRAALEDLPEELRQEVLAHQRGRFLTTPAPPGSLG